VFVTGGNSFQVAGSSGEVSVSGIADPTAAQGIKLFLEKCPSVEVTTRQDKADYIVGVTNDGRSGLEKGRRIVVSTPEGTIILADSARRLKNAVKDACEAITKESLARVPSVASR
jgi:outer membrane lipoprotein SlyB